MIQRLIKEIEVCLKNELYMAALTTVLTLPDICGKAEYPDYGNKRRYIEWLKLYCEISINNLISANEIYQLRNCMLHQGSPTTKLRAEEIDEFELIIQPQNQAKKLMQAVYQMPTKRVLCINIESLCELICSAALSYYANNKEKFNFLNYRIVNTDYWTAKELGLTDAAVKINLK